MRNTQLHTYVFLATRAFAQMDAQYAELMVGLLQRLYAIDENNRTFVTRIVDALDGRAQTRCFSTQIELDAENMAQKLDRVRAELGADRNLARALYEFTQTEIQRMQVLRIEE